MVQMCLTLDLGGKEDVRNRVCVTLVNSTLACLGSGGLKPVSKDDQINLLFTLDILISPD